MEGRTLSGELAGHVNECPGCARYTARLQAAQDLFRQHHGEVEPDAGFAARVAARLPRQSTVVLGWAALRLLPLSVALVLLLFLLSLWVPESTPTQTAAQAPTDDVLTWVIGTDEEAS
jgi:hypothetical protein